MARLKIGLLGGSFNPAHEGHLHISLLALKQLRLDQVWWLVSPQNPLKATEGMAPLADRLASARAMARHPAIHASDLESRLGTRYTVDTLGALQKHWPEHAFVWLMGADNLVQLPRWRRWTEIVETMPMAIFNRSDQGHTSGGHRALAGAAATRYARYRVLRPATLADAKAPAWCFLFSPLHLASSTAIRAETAKLPKEA
ncbi:MAG: nicotinate-nucleotide adenylyltransferase [Rhodospirillaceae bacterium]|jgi:nicotinate-nucleotide adenylyltransferase|nr:nicotinate-nucleotide adenylyltransferase [Rhodospirillaceae bacterium]MBT4042639.1 nicotinate-nucleotide adenylyltransferase [Rhodospirillaceae bacterium]MBT4688825.1 nicotinate-nucleotide adenylyltransferase [Rhodospirillaceae bacterium]MBT5081076.1 nicotinate-nucleotide adenylyltransferase [Rhodospirillaceae bacterium]MBT5523652.1 nicotinate-nucleotide adenylyltransferase [Rhodospirillaceae bacterium]